MTVWDMAIVGAGAAGLGAAEAARAAGLSAVVLEAKDRPGGRAHTVALEPELPWDLGCHWIHSARGNPMVVRAAALGIPAIPDPAEVGWAEDGRRLHGPAERAVEDLLARGWALVEAAGAGGIDVPASAVLAEHGLDGHPARRLFDLWCASHCAVGPELTSTLDHVRYRDGREDWPVPGGYGRVVVAGWEALDVRLETPVRSIRWDHGGVRLETPRGTVEARAAVVTVPPTVLARGAPRFEPPLPDAHARALEAMVLGAAEKVVLRLTARAARRLPQDLLVLSARRAGPGLELHVRPYAKPLVSAFFAGPGAAALTGLSARDAGALVQEAMVELFGAEAGAPESRAVRTAWSEDPHVGGAYSSALPGRAHLREVLASPVAPNLVLAGEASSLDAYSTAHGAAASGAKAASILARALGVRVASDETMSAPADGSSGPRPPARGRR